jgi:Zn finger protein HypA/HybF involved in hydrogenase expression
MSNLIDRQAAIAAIDKEQKEIGVSDVSAMYAYSKCKAIIKQLPPAQPKRGKWVYQMGKIKCDQCLRAIRRIDHDGLLNFCPNCGADMRGEQDG